MGQALPMCEGCQTPRDCDICIDLHNWIMEHMYPQWINANDKKPEKSRDENDELIPYLTYMPDCGIGIAYYVKPLDRFVRNSMLVTVTHWMPLPEPPKLLCT